VAAASLGLTRTHGFFMIMGGFHSCIGPGGVENPYNPDYPLTWKSVISLLESRRIGLPTKEEIQDKSKSDWFVKTVVLFQALWFVTQCIARHIKHLPTTQVEIITLAYTTINFGIFLVWWDKPQNVECPIRVFARPSKEPFRRDKIWWVKVVAVIFGAQESWITLHAEKKVPVFYSGDPKWEQLLLADYITSIATVVFGAIHCIAWSFEFATPIQVFLWRLSAVAITACPVLPVTSLGFILVASDWPALDILTFAFMSCAPLYALSYITARLVTVVLAFINLSSLPPGAFETVHWTTLIPHL
jgi:hypothetical protein